MDQKIIFFDIDGTILSLKTDRISDNTKAAIKQAQANGHLAFINTGRTLSEIEQEIMDVGFDGYVCGCGTYISYGDAVLLQDTIPSDTIQMLIQDLHKYKIEALFEGVSAMYYESLIMNPLIIKIRNSHIKHPTFVVKTLDDPNISADKFCIWPTPDGDFTSFYEKYNKSFDFIDRGNDFYEVIPASHSKATGILFLENHLNISHDNTYALGDSSNDLPMLHYVKYSIAMGNSSEEIREMVSFVTKDVDHDGIAYALKHFNII